MEPKFILKYRNLLWLFAILTGLAFDQLFWQKPGGISFFIFILLAVLGGLIPMWVENITIPWTSYLLLLPVLIFSAFTFIRAEPMTTLMNGLLTVGSLILLTISLRNGDWARYDFKDHVLNLLKFILNCLIGGVAFFLKTQPKPNQQTDSQDRARKEGKNQDGAKRQTRMAYMRGVLLALPIVILLALLLASADPVFGSRILGIFDWFSFEDIGELIFRLTYILILAYLLLGAYFFGLVKSPELNHKSQDDSQDKFFIGTIETSVVFGALNLLFLGFVIIQFTYLFGGDQNISIEGFTYAEYARRGFFELVAVAVISGLIFSVLSRVTERKTPIQKWMVSGLGLTLLALVGIILVSAYTRLTLYEDAYGFTRLRTFTHVFIFWTGGMLAALAFLEVTQKMKRLPFVLILMLMAFGLTINILNVDGFIVKQNVQRAVNPPTEDVDNQLDVAYLSELSLDSVPPLSSNFKDESLPEDLRQKIGGVLACQFTARDLTEKTPWTSWHFARSQAFTQLQDLEDELSGYRVYQSEDPWGWFVDINGDSFPCNAPWD